jgi:hypothetical protein
MRLELRGFVMCLISVLGVAMLVFGNETQIEGRDWQTHLEAAEAALRLGSWDEALVEVEKAEEDWPQMWGCGIAAANVAYQRDLLRAAALEGSGETRSAALIYWSTSNAGPTHEADVRLAELYTAAGRSKELTDILDELDRRFQERARRSWGKHFDPTTQLHDPRAAQVRGAAEMLRAASSGRWPELIEYLAPESGKPSGYRPENWTVYWRPILAARLLAKQPETTVPLVLEVMERLAGEEAAPPNWHDLALGMAGTAPAVARLGERAMRLPEQELPEPGFWVHPDAAAFASIIVQAGEPGAVLLRDLRQSRASPRP